MNKNIARWQHSFISVSILILVLALLYYLLIFPAINSHAELNEQFDDLQFQYSRFSRSINQIESIKEQLQNFQQSQTDQSGFLEEKSEALAAADLQTQIKNLIESSDANLVSTQVIRNQTEDIFPSVTIKVHMRSNIESTQQVLHQLESDKTILLIDNLYIQMRNQSVSRNARTRLRNRQRVNLGTMDVRFEITGFIFQAETT